MLLDIFCEMQKPRQSWGPGHEHTLIRETLEQARLADELGYGCWWQVEHHTAEEFSLSSAPEIMLTTIAQQTQRLRVGHAAVLAPFTMNHPLRVAERAAFLDHVSDGRLELGLARSTTPEWRLFGVDGTAARDQLQETFEMLPKMWTQERFTWRSDHFNIVDRAVIPKPYQKPHPRLWQATSTPSGFEQAGRNGVGALLTTVLYPIEPVAALLEIYRKEIASCKPVGEFVNDQVALFTFVHCARTEQEAIDNGAAAAAAWYVNTILDFFEVRELTLRLTDEFAEAVRRDPKSPLAEYAALAAEAATHAPRTKETELLERMWGGEHITNEEVYEILHKQDAIIIGDVDQCRRKMQRYADIGIDRLMCFQQVGTLSHEQIMSSMRLVGEQLLPGFHAQSAQTK